MRKKLEREKQNSISNGQNINLCGSDCVEGAGVYRETSDKLCKANEPHEAGKPCLAGESREAEVPSGQRTKKKDRCSAFGLSFYDNTGMDAIAQKAYRSDMSDEELKRSRKRDWIYIFIGVPLLIGVIYLIALIVKMTK